MVLISSAGPLQFILLVMLVGLVFPGLIVALILWVMFSESAEN